MTYSQPQAGVFRVQLAELREREAGLREEIAKLTAQRDVLARQARSPDAGARGFAEHQLLQIDLQAASFQAQLGSVQERIAQLGGEIAPSAQPGGSAPPPPLNDPFWRQIDPDAITGVFVMTSLAILLPLSIGISRRLWRRPVTPPPTAVFDDLAKRMERIEHAVDAVAIEVERVSESQRFVAKVLIERRASADVVRASEPDQAAALGEAQPFLALGAGPMEPIPVAQRQAVKQSVTPH